MKRCPIIHWHTANAKHIGRGLRTTMLYFVTCRTCSKRLQNPPSDRPTVNTLKARLSAMLKGAYKGATS